VGIEPIINIHKNADLMLDEGTTRKRRRKMERKIPVRTLVAREQLKDKEKWRRDKDYGKRWMVECVFSAFKRVFGQAISSKKKKYLKNELMIKSNLYNLMLNN
jgi:hypothetical protein